MVKGKRNFIIFILTAYIVENCNFSFISSFSSLLVIILYKNCLGSPINCLSFVFSAQNDTVFLSHSSGQLLYTVLYALKSYENQSVDK